MTVFSVIMIVGISLVFIRLDIELAERDLFFVILSIFILKGAYDFYRLFTTKKPLVYAFATQKKQTTTVAEIIFAILWSNLGFWALLSGFYTVLLMNFTLPFNGAEAYILLTVSVGLASIIGPVTTLFLFSNKRFFLPFISVPLLGLWAYFSWINLGLIILFYLFLSVVSLRFVLESYLFQQQKNRSHENENTQFKGSVLSVFVKESLYLWRERLLLSIIFSASFLGIGTGYLSVYGQSIFLPEEIRFFTMYLSSETYAFVGTYVLVVYSSVFITLNMFLGEKDKVWILKLLPIPANIFVLGKLSALFLSFLTSIPFLAFFIAFTQGESAVSIILLYVFSFLSGTIIAAPLGSKYLGSTSDVLLLYSLSLLMLFVVGINFLIIQYAMHLGLYTTIVIIFVILILLFLLYMSYLISSVFLQKASVT